MADLGFLPGVRRILDRTPRGSQRLLFSATLDKAIDVLVKRFLRQPGHPPGRLGAVAGRHHGPPRAAPGPRAPRPGPRRPDQRPGPHGRLHPHQARRQGADPPAQQQRRPDGRAARQPQPERPHPQHGGLPLRQATTLVATDIAARGIHVDDVALVVHADPPVEHKAYLHRSGRTARAGAKGTVVTLMTDEQVRDVRDLTRAAGIKPTTTRITGCRATRCSPSSRPATRALVPGGLVVEGQPAGSGAAPAAAAVAPAAVAGWQPLRWRRSLRRWPRRLARRSAATAPAAPAPARRPARPVGSGGGNRSRRPASGARQVVHRWRLSRGTAPRRSAPGVADVGCGPAAGRPAPALTVGS